MYIMKREVLVTSAIVAALIGLFTIPGLLDNLVVFVIAGRLPYSEVTLPLMAMFVIYLVLLFLGLRVVLRLGHDAHDEQISQTMKTDQPVDKPKPHKRTTNKASTTKKPVKNPTNKRRRYQAV